MTQNEQPLGSFQSTSVDSGRPLDTSCVIRQSSPPVTPIKKLTINVPAPTMTLPPTPRTSLDERPSTTAGFALLEAPRFAGPLSKGQSLGAGAWSNVYEAERILLPPAHGAYANASLTPPPSPGMPVRAPKRLYAVKVPKPLEANAKKVLAHEAWILTYLSRDPESASFIVGFHGINDASGALVMDRAPLTLKTCIDKSLRLSSTNLSTHNMYDPVVGEEAWKNLARQLITGLVWLHSNGVAHGDIKAENILLRPCGSLSESSSGTFHFEKLADYQPLLCDFSSAHFVDGNSSAEGDAQLYDAFTTAYASPELMSSRLKRPSSPSSQSCDRQQADVWALAVCLVAAAVGSEPYGRAKNEIIRQQMAAFGDVLGDARGNSGHGTRIMKGGYVAKTVARGLAVNPKDRVSASQWLEGLIF